MIKRIVIFSFMFSISGCESFFFNKTGESTEPEIKTHKFYPEERAAIYVDAPIGAQDEVKIIRKPDWMNISISPINAGGGVPFHYLMQKILSSNGINFIFSEDLDPNTQVHINLNGRVEDALDEISHVTGFSYSVSGRTVNWSPYITETFNFSYIPGDYNYLIGSLGSKNSTNSADAEQIEFGAEGEEFSSVTGTSSDAFNEIKSVTEQIIGKYGSVAASRTTSSVIVTTTKARMMQVKNYFKSVEEKLGRQIAFEIKILRFSSNLNGQAGIDWNYLRKNAGNALEFSGGDLGSITSGSPITFKATQVGTNTDGSNVLVSLLEQQGTVSISNSPKVVTQPNRVVELELSDLQGYIARTDVTPSTSLSSSEPSVALRQGIVKSGYRMLALSNIGDNNKITLHLSSTYIPEPVIERKEVLTSAIETPKMTRNRLVSTTVLRNGETMILSGLQIDTDANSGESPLSARYLPTRKLRKSSSTEIIVLITPVILDMN